MAKGTKDPYTHVAGVGEQYKMYNSIIFINLSADLKSETRKVNVVYNAI
jgi:hypothetical protein